MNNAHSYYLIKSIITFSNLLTDEFTYEWAKDNKILLLFTNKIIITI